MFSKNLGIRLDTVCDLWVGNTLSQVFVIEDMGNVFKRFRHKT